MFKLDYILEKTSKEDNDMDLIKWNPFKDLKIMTKDFDSMFDGFEEFFAPTSSIKFDMDIYEDNEKNMFYIKCHMPGISKENIDITINGDALTISAHQSSENESKMKYYRKEICKTSYQRSIRIPFDIEKDKVEAQYKDGELLISIPRSEIKSPNKIEVK